MRLHGTKSSSQSGGALLVAVIATIVLSGMAGAILAFSTASKSEHSAATDHLRALYVAEAGISDGIASVTANAPQNFGSALAPVPFAHGGYWGTVTDNLDGTMTIVSYGSSRGAQRGLEAVMLMTDDGIFDCALFAGNSSGDPNYDLRFGGLGVQADVVSGNVYSGGDILVAGDASISGEVHASGGITGVAGEEGKKKPIPDIAAMKYSVNNDFDVAALFSTATYASSAYGGNAWQLPESSPAHIFRKNPDDRATDINKTVKDDYFLEDPYEPLSSSSTIDPSAGSRITLSGLGGKPGVNGNDKIYYIDGNLWVHNRNLYSFTMTNDGPEDLHVTFVVRGNVYFSDNVFYQDPAKDGVAFIAIRDEAEPDSGNVYFGDPAFGTLEQMDAFMYAEHDFYDNNLSATGSAQVTVHGNMTAGNQVLINRDFGAQHSRLTVKYDDRISTGALSLPGLPKQSGASATWTLASWREIAVP